MCIIFGMIERNVACCHACTAPLQHRGERLVHLQISPSRRDCRLSREESERALPFLIIRLFPERGETSDFLSLPLSFLLSSTYYLSSPNSRRSPSARSSSFSPNSLFFSRRSFFFSFLRSRSRSATVTVAPDSPLFFLDDHVYFHEIVPPYTNFDATWWHGR